MGQDHRLLHRDLGKPIHRVVCSTLCRRCVTGILLDHNMARLQSSLTLYRVKMSERSPHVPVLARGELCPVL